MTVVEETKACPFCAETIKAAAVVCRFCGHELVPGALPVQGSAAPAPVTSEARATLEKEMAAYTRQGWKITSQGETSFQATKSKTWNRAGVLIFVVLPVLLAIILWWPLITVAVVGLFLITADYMMKKEQTTFISLSSLQQGQSGLPRVSFDVNGKAFCTKCKEYVRADATECKHCRAKFV